MGKQPLNERFYIILNTFMILFYAGIAVYFFFWNPTSLTDTIRKIFCGALVLYSIYRGILLYRKINKPADEE